MSKLIDHRPFEHPPESLLEDLVAGELFAPERALLEAHLDKCVECRQKLADLAAPAGELLRSFGLGRQPSVPSAPSEASDRLWQRLQAALPDLESELDPFGDLPVPQASRVELNLRTPLQWEEIGPARVAQVAACPERDYRCFLVDTPGASVFPHHRHLGYEDLVVLQGGLTDDFGHMGVGDYRRYPPGSEHAPRMDTGPRCIALTLVRDGLQFASPS